MIIHLISLKSACSAHAYSVRSAYAVGSKVFKDIISIFFEGGQKVGGHGHSGRPYGAGPDDGMQ